MNLLEVARIIHAAKLTFEQVVGEQSQPWASRAVREETVDLVKDIREASGWASSKFWNERMNTNKEMQTWSYGDEYSRERKTTPYWRYWHELTDIQRCKIDMIYGLALSLLSQVDL